MTFSLYYLSQIRCWFNKICNSKIDMCSFIFPRHLSLFFSSYAFVHIHNLYHTNEYSRLLFEWFYSYQYQAILTINNANIILSIWVEKQPKITHWDMQHQHHDHGYINSQTNRLIHNCLYGIHYHCNVHW